MRLYKYMNSNDLGGLGSLVNSFNNFDHLHFLEFLVSYVWGLPLLILISFVSIYLLFVSRGLPLMHFVLAWKLVFGKTQIESLLKTENQNKPDSSDNGLQGQISQFKTLANAVASTVGMGNIAGVAVALERGGPGAIFWMWVAGLVGMNTKFFECTLAVMFRERDAKGEVQGGPMYYIPHAFSNRMVGKILTYVFVLGAMLGTLDLFQSSQVALFLKKEFSVNSYLVGAFIFFSVGYVLVGGLQRLSDWTSVIVPIMCWAYIVLSLIIIIGNYDKIGECFVLIFQGAFSPKSMGGGFAGYSVYYIFRQGVQRAAFSNEAGMGTAPMAHGNSNVKEPLSEGFVAMLGPFIDTVIICTLTALVLLIATPLAQFGDLKEIAWISSIYGNYFGEASKYILFLMIFLFAFSTMIGFANYNEKCWMFLFGKTKFLSNRNVFVFFFCTTLFLGAINSGDFAVGIVDLGFGIMAYVNLLTIAILAPKVKERLNRFNL